MPLCLTGCCCAVFLLAVPALPSAGRGSADSFFICMSHAGTGEYSEPLTPEQQHQVCIFNLWIVLQPTTCHAAARLLVSVMPACDVLTMCCDVAGFPIAATADVGFICHYVPTFILTLV